MKGSTAEFVPFLIVPHADGQVPPTFVKNAQSVTLTMLPTTSV